jgi:hypothetical protein
MKEGSAIGKRGRVMAAQVVGGKRGGPRAPWWCADGGKRGGGLVSTPAVGSRAWASTSLLGVHGGVRATSGWRAGRS